MSSFIQNKENYENKLSDYIKEHYDIVWQHPEATPADWKTFLLEELHIHSVQQINGLFISLFAKPGSVGLIEWTESLKVRTPLSEKIQPLFIDPSVILPENTLGWDSLSSAEQLQGIILGSAKGCLETQIFSYIFISSFWWPSPNRMKEYISSHLETETDEVLSKALSEIVIPFLKVKIIPLAEEAYRIYDTTEMEEEHSRQIESLRRQACDRFEEKILELDNMIDELLAKTFPDRVQAMIQTLQNVASYVKGEGQVYLMAGALHLREHPDYQDNPVFSLKLLYDFLKDKKHIVILEPKAVTPWYSKKIKIQLNPKDDGTRT